MNLEQIDTSTTAGKARVMQLAAEGRRVAYSPRREAAHWVEGHNPVWDWHTVDYAIISEPVGPEEEVWVQQRNGALWAYPEERDESVRYIRADLAEEKG